MLRNKLIYTGVIAAVVTLWLAIPSRTTLAQINDVDWALLRE
jgi:hypothetical protein